MHRCRGAVRPRTAKDQTAEQDAWIACCDCLSCQRVCFCWNQAKVPYPFLSGRKGQVERQLPVEECHTQRTVRAAGDGNEDLATRSVGRQSAGVAAGVDNQDPSPPQHVAPNFGRGRPGTSAQLRRRRLARGVQRKCLACGFRSRWDACITRNRRARCSVTA